MCIDQRSGSYSIRRTVSDYWLVHRLLKDGGNTKFSRTYVGEYATSLEMTGLSISLLKVDEELKRLMDAAADTPMFKQFGESK